MATSFVLAVVVYARPALRRNERPNWLIWGLVSGYILGYPPKIPGFAIGWYVVDKRADIQKHHEASQP